MEQHDKFDLNNRPRQHPFTVPEGYFNDLPMRIQQRVQEQQRARTSVWAWLQQLRWQPALAAACVLVVAVWFALFRHEQPAQQQQVALHELSDEEILHYLSNQPLALDARDLATVSYIDQHLPAALPEVSPQDLEEDLDLHTMEEYYQL